MSEVKQKISLAEYTDLHWLKKNYFSLEEQKLLLKKGDSVTQQGQLNNRMFFVESGQLSGYFQPAIGEEYVIFTSRENMIAGLYSFFSHDHLSYTTLKAEKDSVVFYVTNDQIPEKGTEGYAKFLQHTMPIVVNEIYHRQMRAIKITAEKEAAFDKLIETERMGALGQLAAGLAHELNNAISVILGKTEWFTRNLNKYVNEKDSKGFYPFFLQAMENGQTKTSRELRELRRSLMKEYALEESKAHVLARTTFPHERFSEVKHWTDDYFTRLEYYWEAGLTLHDLRIASEHTSHVIQSMRELGAVNRDKTNQFPLSRVVHKSLSLLKKELQPIDVKVAVSDSSQMEGREGDVLQVLLNLIKNAAESLLEFKVKQPVIEIKADEREKDICLSVTDNGVGISAEDMEKIFQPSFTTKVKGLSFGLGLGLSIVQKIVSDYGGLITLSSAPGKTRFFIRIPKKG